MNDLEMRSKLPSVESEQHRPVGHHLSQKIVRSVKPVGRFEVALLSFTLD